MHKVSLAHNVSFWAQKLTHNISFWGQKSKYPVQMISGARKGQNVSVSGQEIAKMIQIISGMVSFCGQKLTLGVRDT